MSKQKLLAESFDEGLFCIKLILQRVYKEQTKNMKFKYSEAELSEIVQMALSDHISFGDINTQYGLGEKEVVKLMRLNLKKGSYRAWRKRVNTFGSRREFYK